MLIIFPRFYGRAGHAFLRPTTPIAVISDSKIRQKLRNIPASKYNWTIKFKKTCEISEKRQGRRIDLRELDLVGSK